MLETSLVADKISAYCEFLIPEFEKYTVWNRPVGSLKMMMMIMMMLINCDLTKQNYQEKAINLPDKLKKLRITVTVVRNSNTLCSCISLYPGEGLERTT